MLPLHHAQHVPVDIIQVLVQVNVSIAKLVNMQNPVQQNVTYAQQELYPTQRLLLVHHVQMACIPILEVQDVLAVLFLKCIYYSHT